MYTIALLEDHELYRKGLKLLLEQAGRFNVVIEASGGADFFNQFSSQQQPPQIVITDIQMPGMNGYEVILELRKRYPSIIIICLSMFSHEHTISKAFTMGANAFVAKSCEYKNFLEMIVRLVNEDVLICMGPDGDTVILNNPKEMNHPSLSEKQKAFLELCSYPDLSYKMIADRLSISLKTADRHRDLLFKKLNVSSRAGLMLYAIHTGLAGPVPLIRMSN
jgi:two-component system invasion response regulator UvrY